MEARATFLTTRWSQVLDARGESEASQKALSDLCAAYYLPVESFIASRAADREAARDLTQSFFARLIEKGGLASLKPGRSRFRSFLLGAVKHFLADEYDKAQAAKRGAGVERVSIQAPTDTSPGFDVSDPGTLMPEKIYDREWAMTVIQQSLDRLKADYESTGKVAQFDVLKHWLPGNSTLEASVAAARLNLTEGALKVAIHRLRKRFRSVVRTEVAQTVSNAEDVQAELKYLIEVLS